MTILEAISGEIEPYGLSDESMEKAFIDAYGRFGSDIELTGVNDTYSFNAKKVVAFAAMLCLCKLLSLTSENMGGISQNYDVKKLEKRIRGIATENGISADLVLEGSSDGTINCTPIW